MKLVFFAHPDFLGSQSMRRFASMLSDGMESRGHQVAVWRPKAVLSKISSPAFIKKWLGYADQYILFYFKISRLLKRCSPDTIFVFTDQALGPWVPWIGNRPHIIHCHDFLAQRSALGTIPENPTKWFGKQYQSYIRRGYQKGKNFISVSKKTQSDLHQFLMHPPLLSEVVYNGLNQSFSVANAAQARAVLGKRVKLDLANGYILHTGGNQWYKNRPGVIKIYNAFRAQSKSKLPVLLIGKNPAPELKLAYLNSPFKADIHFLSDIDDEMLMTAYSGASVFIFPSLAEGFGWPIAEAMASGCPVITTDEAPMTEVAGEAGFLIPRMPNNEAAIAQWQDISANAVNSVVTLTDEERGKVIDRGVLNSKRFDAADTLNAIENIYKIIKPG